MSSENLLQQARAIVMDCLYDEVALLLKSHGVSSARIDGELLSIYARAKFDARRYAPRLEGR